MYRCTDCNKKYETKPEYCNCGNNTFVQEVLQTAKIKEEPETKTFFEQYPEIKKFADSVDIASGTIFVSCLILSVIFWNLIGSWTPSPTEPESPAPQEQTKVQNPNIPDVDSLWNNTPPKPHKEESAAPELPVLPPVQPQTEEPTQEPKTILPFVNLPAKPAPRAVAPKPIPAQPKPHHSLLNQDLSSMNSEMKNYTNGLRDALFSQWAVGSVSGEGRCEVEFSISNSGKLLGRRFSKQSDNDSLNNAVYGMLMNTPQYSAPPRSYNGEKIRLSIYFNHGYYEMDYPKY